MSSKNVRIGSEAHSLLFSVYPRIRLPGREAYRSTFPSALMPWCLNKHSGKSSCSLPLFIQTLELRFAWSFHKILITFYLLAVPLLTQRRLQVTNYQTVGQPRAPLDGHVENRVCVCVCVSGTDVQHLHVASKPRSQSRMWPNFAKLPLAFRRPTAVIYTCSLIEVIDVNMQLLLLLLLLLSSSSSSSSNR